MHQLGRIRLVDQLDSDRAPLAQPYDRSWNTAVVADGADDHVWCELHEHGRDADGHVRRPFGRFGGLSGGVTTVRWAAAHREPQSCDGAQPQDVPACQSDLALHVQPPVHDPGAHPEPATLRAA